MERICIIHIRHWQPKELPPFPSYLHQPRDVCPGWIITTNAEISPRPAGTLVSQERPFITGTNAINLFIWNPWKRKAADPKEPGNGKSPGSKKEEYLPCEENISAMARKN